MTDLHGPKPKVYFLESLPDPAAPTLVDLAAATDLSEAISEVTFEREYLDERIVLASPQPATLTLTIRASERSIRDIRRTLRRFERNIQRWRRNPRRAAMHAEYARRRKARTRRR